METLRSGVYWQKWISLLIFACAVLAYKKIDAPGYTRQYISKINHDCRDFKAALDKCRVWKDMGFCFKYRRQMQHVCNRTCQYCVPGQKQWQVIDRIWGRVKESGSQQASTHALASALQHKGPAIQILGKERAPQVDDAASAIATQLEEGVDRDVSGSPNVLGQLTKSHSDVQSKLGPTVAINGTANDATKSKLSTSVPPTDHNKQGAQPITTISGKTQVREANKDERPVVVLMGYELGEKSSKKVHEVLRNSDPNQFSDQEKIKAVGLHRELANDRSAVNRTSAVRNGQANARTTAERIATESFVPDSELEEIAELLDNAASASRRLHENKHHMHEGKGKLNTNANTLQLKMHATDLSREATSALQSKVMHDRGRKNSNPSLPISSDDVVNQQAFQRMTTLGSHLENKDSDLHVKSDTSASMVNGTVTSNHSESMERDLPMIVPGNKHQNINDPRLQMNPPIQKPALSVAPGKQVTLTINEKPGTGEAVFKVLNTPHASGVSYTTDGTPGGLPSPNYFLQNENEEARAKSEEEETKIREATQAIKNVMKLFDRGNRHGHGHMRTRLVTQATQDFPAASKSLEANQELAGLQSEIEAQAQSQDGAAARAQALSQGIGHEITSTGMGTGVSNVPNYAVISTSDSKDWKNLAHVLAAQLKHVLNHMEDREKENQYEKEKMQEEMMLIAQQQMGREDDEGPDDDDDEDDEMSDREKRRHSVLSPYVNKSSKNALKNIGLKDKPLRKLKFSRKMTEHKLLQRAVQKLSRLEMLHKSQRQTQSTFHR